MTQHTHSREGPAICRGESRQSRRCAESTSLQLSTLFTWKHGLALKRVFPCFEPESVHSTYKNFSTRRRDINTIISYYTTTQLSNFPSNIFFSFPIHPSHNLVYGHASHMLFAGNIRHGHPTRAFNIRQPYSANDSSHNDSSNYEIGI